MESCSRDDILIRRRRAGPRRRDGLLMGRRISSFDLVLYLETLQDGEYGVKSCGGLALNYLFIFTGDTVFSRLIYPLSSSSYTYSSSSLLSWYFFGLYIQQTLNSIAMPDPHLTEIYDMCTPALPAPTKISILLYFRQEHPS